MVNLGVDTVRDAVLASIDEQRLVRLAQDLIRLDTTSPPGNEQIVADFVAAYLGRLGLETQIQMVQPGQANVLARLGRAGERPHLILNGHTDTVPVGDGWTFEPHGGQRQAGRLYGRGASDMKGGLAAMIAAVMDEEEDQEGTRYPVEHGLRGDFAIVGEPTELLPVIAHKGDVCVEVVTHGVEAHASTPEAGGQRH
jgi:succinyl-diaminopimelate desuccinylase